MRYKVKIKKLPQARTGYQVQGSLANDVPAFGGADYNSYIGTPNLKASRYIKAVPREEANLEAEGGETVYGDLNGDSIPEHKIIKGPRHTQGGVPLKLPDDSFIFSDTRSMKINNPDILQMFGKAPKKQKGKSGFTPAELAKQYDIENYRKILQDPNSDAVDKKTAELMIRNYNMKLGALALAQESKKGFPQGIPVMAQPYMEAAGIQPEQILPPELPEPQAPSQEDMMMMQQQGQPQMPQEMQQQMMPPMAAYGMEMGGYDFPYLPMAEYGMPMGAGMSQNYQGRDRFIYQNGGEPPKDGVILKRSDYATKADYEKALKLWYYKNGKAGTKLYVQQADGQYKPISFKYTAPAAATGTIDPGWGSGDRSAKIAGQYAAIEAALKDPVTAKLFVDATREVIKDQESYRSKDRKNPDGTIKKGVIGKGFGKLNANDPNSPDYLSDDDIIKNFTEHQKRNLMISAQGYESYLFTDREGKLRSYDSTGDGKDDNMGFKDVIMKTNNPKTGKPYTEAEAKAEFDRFGKENVKTLDDAFTKIGLPLPAVTAGSGSADEKKALLQQATFQGYNKLYNNLQSGKITDENQILGLLNFRGNLQRGFEDENVAGVSNISPIDAFYTNTTAGQISAYENLNFEELTLDCPCTGEDGKPMQRDAQGNCPCEEDCPCGKDENGNCKECDEIIPPKAPPANWWLQDTIKTTGAFGDLMGIDKQMPWSPRVDLEEPRPTFLDPTRELAQQSEQANIATQSLAQFVGPQALSARASSIQGTGAKQAADTLSRFNNANSNIANQFEFKSTDIRNQEALANQASQQKLYDSNIIANQQYSNAKLAMRNQLRNYYTDALTNKGKTAALNNLYPQYAVLPETGGMPAFKGGRKNKPEISKSSQDYFDEIKQQYPDLDDKTAYQMAKDRAAQQDSSAGVDPQKVLEMQYNLKKGGPVYVMGDNVFPFMFY
jgi:hypothetical protein